MHLRYLRVLIGATVAALGAITACGLDTQATNGGGFHVPDGGPDSTATGGTGVGGSGTGGVSPTGGSGPTGGTGGGTAGSGGSGGATGGAAGMGGTGGTVGDSCNGNCPSPDTCTAGVCSCPADYTDTDGNPSDDKAKCVQDSLVVKSLTVTVGVRHGHCGELTYKLTGPSGQTITLMSRPGAAETTDDGQENITGNSAQLDEGHTLTFDDSASPSAEQVGDGLSYQDTVCSNAATCSYKPDHGAASGPATLSQAFANTDLTGVWKLCVGDSVGNWFQYNSSGTIRSWSLAIVTASGNANKASGSITVAIPDDGYDGTSVPSSMACTTLTLP